MAQSDPAGADPTGSPCSELITLHRVADFRWLALGLYPKGWPQ